MLQPIRRSPLSRRYPRTERALDLGFLVPLGLSVFALIWVVGML